jgi:hypothetical protein
MTLHAFTPNSSYFALEQSVSRLVFLQI